MTNRGVFLPFAFARLIGCEVFGRLSVPLRTTHRTEVLRGLHRLPGACSGPFSVPALVPSLFYLPTAPDLPHLLQTSKSKPAFLSLSPAPVSAWIFATATVIPSVAQDSPHRWFVPVTSTPPEPRFSFAVVSHKGPSHCAVLSSGPTCVWISYGYTDRLSFAVPRILWPHGRHHFKLLGIFFSLSFP